MIELAGYIVAIAVVGFVAWAILLWFASEIGKDITGIRKWRERRAAARSAGRSTAGPT